MLVMLGCLTNKNHRCKNEWAASLPSTEVFTNRKSPIHTEAKLVYSSVHQPRLLIESDIKHPRLKSSRTIRNRMWGSGVDFVLWRTTPVLHCLCQPRPGATAEHGLFFLLARRPHLFPLPLSLAEPPPPPPTHTHTPKPQPLL